MIIIFFFYLIIQIHTIERASKRTNERVTMSCQRCGKSALPVCGLCGNLPGEGGCPQCRRFRERRTPHDEHQRERGNTLLRCPQCGWHNRTAHQSSASCGSVAPLRLRANRAVTPRGERGPLRHPVTETVTPKESGGAWWSRVSQLLSDCAVAAAIAECGDIPCP